MAKLDELIRKQRKNSIDIDSLRKDYSPAKIKEKENTIAKESILKQTTKKYLKLTDWINKVQFEQNFVTQGRKLNSEEIQRCLIILNVFNLNGKTLKLLSLLLLITQSEVVRFPPRIFTSFFDVSYTQFYRFRDEVKKFALIDMYSDRHENGFWFVEFNKLIYEASYFFGKQR